jgi:methylenetetrahydrofolate dehydrogenase (NADP+) / methenyltetrahydrofolate cyclohydrolase
MLLIDGTAIAASIREEVRVAVAGMAKPPGLATVLVGEDPASHAYVRGKRKVCGELGIASFHHELPASVSEREVTDLVDALAADARVHGILVQLPLPKGLDEERVVAHIPRHKNVDGFDPVDIGLLGQKGRRALFEPCTPAGCIALLERSGIRIAGAHAVVLGRSSIVGLPVSLMLLQRDATVTVCHSKTRDLAAQCRQADILIAAIGRPNFVTADMVKPGAAVIDVGINRIADASRKTGTRLIGDVDFDAVAPIAGALTPVPGGVGPMTIAMLMRNTLRAAQSV